MKLGKFRKDKKVSNKMIFIGFILFALFLGITLYRTYALYEEKVEFNVIRGKVPEFAAAGNDISLAILVNGKRQSTFPEKHEGYTIDKVECTKNAIGTWDSENWQIYIKNLKENNTICTVSFKRYADSILNGADPKLGENLVPVKIEDDGTVTKADTMQEWYNYSNKEWANAVILLDKTITYNNNEVIPEENIESYFVWIPRYKYKIWDEGKYESLTGTLTADKLGMATSKAHKIEVEFETKDMAISSGSTVDSWLTHPAFTAFDVNGLWVGKFETSYKDQSTMNPGEAITNVNAPTKVQIKPNVYSWRYIQVSNAHLTSYNYQRDLDSHMMKNTEWGAVAYLQHSAYGSQASVRINNNISYLTGYASVNEPTCGHTGTNEECNKYGTTEDITVDYFSTNTDSTGNKVVNLASTTGNKTGAFDMSGGAWEYMMGVMVDQAGNPASGRHNIYNSGFNGTLTCPTCTDSGVTVDKTITSVTGKTDFPDAKYYDKYAYGTNAQRYKDRILGDATGEMGPFAQATYGTANRQIGSWYNDEAWFVISYWPWFTRGGLFHLGLGAGVFDFYYANGHAFSDRSFRIVLAV